MPNLSKTMFALAARAAMATSTLSQGPCGVNPVMVCLCGGPGKMIAVTLASLFKGHPAMIMSARRVPGNAISSMDKGRMYMVSGMFDPTGSLYRR
jgi:hypothetical protein